jgi:hypothetical protein
MPAQHILLVEDDPDLLSLGVEWIFQVHNNRATVAGQAADLTMARNYAAQSAASAPIRSNTFAVGPRTSLAPHAESVSRSN